MPAKAQNRKKRWKANRSGRPRDETAMRTPSGQKSRSKQAAAAAQRETERQTMATATEARQRHTGLSEAQASRPETGTALGLLLLDRQISQRQYEAGEHYAEAVYKYHMLTGVPFPSARAQDLFRVHGFEAEVPQHRLEAARDATNRKMGLEGILLSCGQNGRLVASRVHEVCVLDNKACREWNLFMLGLVRRGLSAIVGEMT